MAREGQDEMTTDEHTAEPAGTRGRPPSTTREEVARVALELFVRNGFEETTVDDIAEEIGISRRTLFRYYASKNDMVWGDFDWVLGRLREAFEDSPEGEPLMATLRRAVVESNRYDAPTEEELRIRMTLITTVPALQAHSMLRYAAWRGVVADFAAERLRTRSDELVPQVVAHTALAVSMAAFVRWVHEPSASLEANIEEAFDVIAAGLAVDEHGGLATG
jgi:mycofactocin system transcriptional regulator